MCAAPARWRAAAILTAPTVSSSSASTTPPWLDGQYTVWGKVTEGMEHIDAIKKGGDRDGAVVDPDKIISMTLP